MHKLRRVLAAAVLILSACGLAQATRRGLSRQAGSQEIPTATAAQQQRQLQQRGATGATSPFPAAANPSAPPHTVSSPAPPTVSAAASPTPATTSSTVNPAPVGNASAPTGCEGCSPQAAVPTSSDGCQYMKGLQFEGQLSAYDSGFKFTEFTLNNLNRFIGITGTYWELHPANTPQDCCQLCKASNATHAAAAAASTISASSSGSYSDDQPVNFTMRDPCLYFTWVPSKSSSQKAAASGLASTSGRTSGMSNSGREATNAQQRVTTPELTARPPNPTPNPTNHSADVVAMDGPGAEGFNQGVGVQGGACLLVGGGFSWVDAEKSDFGAVSGLLYPG